MTAQTEAERLLPCATGDWGCVISDAGSVHMPGCGSIFRPAVAQALAERDVRIADQDTELARLERIVGDLNNELEMVESDGCSEDNEIMRLNAEIGRLRVALTGMRDAAVYQCAAHARGGKKLLDEANSKLVDALSVGRAALAGEK
jgi:hypothetical protein